MENMRQLNKNINRAKELIKEQDIETDRINYIVNKMKRLCLLYCKNINFDITSIDYEDLDPNYLAEVDKIGKNMLSLKKILNNTTIGTKYKARHFIKNMNELKECLNKYIILD